MVDPVCGMLVDPDSKLSTTYNGKEYFFCSEECKEEFLSAPELYEPEEYEDS